MNLTTLANAVTAILCIAVLVQSVRMMRSLGELRGGGGMAEVVAALDTSTQQAQRVLHELRRSLVDCAASAEIVAQGKVMSDELTVMIGIANASADRMAETANALRREQAEGAYR